MTDEVNSHTWVYHPGLDRWSEVSVESIESWEDLGWKHQPEGPPGLNEEMFSAVELAARAEQLGIVVVPPEEPEKDEGLSIQSPDVNLSTRSASLKQDSGTPQED